MTYARAIAAGAALVGALGGAPLTLAGQSTGTYVEIGRAIAHAFDSTHGMPVESRTGHDCFGFRRCPRASNPTPADVEASSAVARGLADVLDVPLESAESPQTRCPKAPGEVEGRIGLWTRFGVVSTSSDSAEVMVISGCRAHGPVRTATFSQAYLYTLHRTDSGGWNVLSVELVWIT